MSRACVHAALARAQRVADVIRLSDPELLQCAPRENVNRASVVLAGAHTVLRNNPELVKTLEQESTNEVGRLTMLVVPEFPLVLASLGKYVTALAPMLAGTRRAIDQTAAAEPERWYYTLSSHGSLEHAVWEHMEQDGRAFRFDPATMRPADFIALAVTTFFNEPFRLYFDPDDARYIPRRITRRERASPLEIEGAAIIEMGGIQSEYLSDKTRYVEPLLADDAQEVPAESTKQRPWHPILTIRQQQRIIDLRSSEHTIDDLFDDEQFRMDIQADDAERWQRIYKLSKGDITAVLVLCNDRFLGKVVRTFTKSPLATDIPYQVLKDGASEGVRKAADRFDSNYLASGKQQSFLTYATPIVREEIRKTIRHELNITKPQYEHLAIALRVRHAFFHKTGRDPEDLELGEQLLHNTTFSQSMIDFVIEFGQRHRLLYLDRVIRKQHSSAAGERTLHDVIPTVSSAESADRRERDAQQEALTIAFRRLTDLQRNIIRDSYGWNALAEPLTPAELARKYGLPVAEVAGIVQEALRALKAEPTLSPVARGRTKPAGQTDYEPIAGEDPDSELFEAALRGEGMSRRERIRILSKKLGPPAIAKTVGITRQRVDKIQKELVRLGELVDPVRVHYMIPDSKRDARLVRLYWAGMTEEKMASELSLSVSWVQRAVRRLIKEGRLQPRRVSRGERLRLAPAPSPEVALVAEWFEENCPNALFWKKVKAAQAAA